MTLEELKASLQTERDFRNLDDWTFQPVGGGGTSAHTYRLRCRRADYFVKEVKDNEREALKLIAPLGLRHIERVIHPDLLDRNVLVTDYISGRPIESNNLEPSLVQDFATIQNRVGRPESGNSPPASDGVGLDEHALRCFEQGHANVSALEQHGFDIATSYRKLADHLMDRQGEIVGDYSAMPEAWQHHDFREANILGRDPQKIVDWGSSYGSGPFLFDMAPVVFSHEANRRVFLEHSEICREADTSTVERWIYTAACVRLMEFLRYFVPSLVASDDKPASAGYLAYHYETYGGLRT
jgi:hypothetical protein